MPTPAKNARSNGNKVDSNEEQVELSKKIQSELLDIV